MYMSSSNILMRLKIGKLTGYYQEKDKEPIDFIQSILDEMFMKTHIDYPNKIFYMIGDKVYFEMNKDIQKRRTDNLWCRYEDFWELLEQKYLLNYTDIQILIKSMVEHHLKCSVGTPNRIRSSFRKYEVEQHLKCSVGTPNNTYSAIL